MSVIVVRKVTGRLYKVNHCHEICYDEVIKFCLPSCCYFGFRKVPARRRGNIV